MRILCYLSYSNSNLMLCPCFFIRIGVIIRKTNVATAVAETNKTLFKMVDEDFYQDEYSIRLTRAPANGTTVEIDITSIAVAADKEDSIFTPEY